MSKKFRQKILKDFVKAPRAKAEKAIKDFFDNGNIRIERKDWDNVFSKAQSNLKEIHGTIPITDTEWELITSFIHTNFKSDSIMFVSPVFEKSSKHIKKFYKRQNKPGITGQGIVDLEAHVVKVLRKIMSDYFVSGQYEGLEKRVINKTASEQEYEHGDRQEPLFSDTGQYFEGGTNNPKNKGIVEGLRNTLPGKKGSLSPGGRGQAASGAKGTLSDKKLAAALKSSAIKQFKTQSWFTIVHEVISLKWAEIFGYDTSVKSTDSNTEVIDQVTLSGILLPKAYSEAMKTNKGKFDAAIQKELEEFLKNDEYFMSELIRLKPSAQQQAARLTSGSQDNQKRLEEAAIKLAAQGVLDSLHEKTVRNDKSGSLKRKKKRGKSSTSAKSGRGRRKTSTTRSSTVKRGRGRPTKVSQALGGNPIALKEIINARLPQELLKQMQLPKLRNRTGRFRQSAQVTNVMMGPQGGTHIEYTYMKNPYQTFEPGGAQGSVNRDPRRLIGGTVREIAQQIMGKRFIRVRSV